MYKGHGFSIQVIHSLNNSTRIFNLLSILNSSLQLHLFTYLKSVTYLPTPSFNMPSFTTVVAAIAGCSAIVNGAAIPSESGLHTTTLHTRDMAKNPAHVLSKREPVTVAILTAAGTAAATAIVTEAVNAAVAFIGDVANFDSAREAFTVQTTDAMMANNPDPARFQAAACYNKGFSVADPANIDGQSSVEFKLGLLNTDYECMYIAAPNQFFTEGDGGLINVSANPVTHTMAILANSINSFPLPIPTDAPLTRRPPISHVFK
jgi:hypothetical protein